MGKFRFAVVIALFIALGGGCDYGEEKRYAANMENHLNSIDQELPDQEYLKIKTYDYLSKKDAIEEFKEALAALDAKIDALEKRISVQNPQIGHNIKQKWKEDLENFRLQREKLLVDYDKLKKATPENWASAQAAFAARWSKLEDRWGGKMSE